MRNIHITAGPDKEGIATKELEADVAEKQRHITAGPDKEGIATMK